MKEAYIHGSFMEYCARLRPNPNPVQWSLNRGLFLSLGGVTRLRKKALFQHLATKIQWWWRIPLHRWCPFTFLTLAGVLIGWVAAPFSSERLNGGEDCERRSESPLTLALKGPAAEKFWGLKILSLDIGQLFENNKKKKGNFAHHSSQTE